MESLHDKVKSFLNSIEGFNTEFTEKQQQVIIDAFNLFANKVQEWVIEEFAPKVQKWIDEEYTPALRITINKSDEEETTEEK